MRQVEFTRKSEFINVEIAIKTDHDSTAFVKWLEDRGNYVNKVEWNPQKWYIYSDPARGRSANSVIRKLCKMIEQFPEDVRRDWNRAKHREFYAGYYGGDNPRCLEEHISLDTIKAAVAVKASIGFALYPAIPTDEKGIPQEFCEEESQQ